MLTCNDHWLKIVSPVIDEWSTKIEYIMNWIYQLLQIITKLGVVQTKPILRPSLGLSCINHELPTSALNLALSIKMYQLELGLKHKDRQQHIQNPIKLLAQFISSQILQKLSTNQLFSSSPAPLVSWDASIFDTSPELHKDMPGWALSFLNPSRDGSSNKVLGIDCRKLK